MGVSCQIFIHNPAGGVHKAGKPVTGVIKYAIDTPTEYKNIVLSLVGKGKVYWTETRMDTNDKTVTDSYHGTEEYVSQSITVLNKTSTLPFGCYEHPFHFCLPYNIPSSRKSNHMGVTCHIHYEIIMKFKKSSFFSFDTKFTKEIIVYGNVSISTPFMPLTYEMEKSLFSLFSSNENKVYLKCEIPKSLYVPGENINIKCLITNNSDKRITAIKSELMSKTIYTAYGGRTKSFEQRINQCTCESPAIFVNSVAIVHLTNSTLPELYSIQHSKIVDRCYFLRVTVKLPMPHISKSIDIPLAIGETCVEGSAEAVDKEIDWVIDDAEIEDNPPSYWQVMMEDKCQDGN